MTRKEFYESIVKGAIDDVTVTYAAEQLKKITDVDEKKAAENAALAKKMITLLTKEPTTAGEVAKTLEISSQKASTHLRKLAAAGTIEQGEITLKGRTVKTYFTK